jgi:hypothetical protein
LFICVFICFFVDLRFRAESQQIVRLHPGEAPLLFSHKNIWMFRWPKQDKTKRYWRQSVSAEISMQAARQTQKCKRPPEGGLITILIRWRLNARPALA